MIYRLDHELSHLDTEGAYDASLIRFPNDVEARFSNPSIDYASRAPEVIEFVGDLDRLRVTDYPYLDRTLPLMSSKLLLSLLSVGEFPYRLFPTRIYDQALTDQVRYASNYFRTEYQVTDASRFTEAFSIVQLLEWTNVVDYDRTICAVEQGGKYRAVRASELEDVYLDSDMIERLALTVPEDSLPGVFRIRGLMGLLCTDRTVAACRQANVVGVHFTPIPTPLASGLRSVPGGARLVPAEQFPT